LWVTLVPAHLELIQPEITLVRIEVPPESMAINVLIEDVALKDSTLQSQPFPRISGDADAESAHRIARPPSGNVGVKKGRPSESAVRKKSSIVGNYELTVGCELPNANRKARRSVIFALE